MKIIEKNLHKGYIKLIPESADDFWHLYNIIQKGDEVYAYSSRVIKTDQEYSRPKSGERVSAFMGVKVEDASWDKFLGKLRVHGIICEAPDIIPPGAHHTLSISLLQPLTIVKEEWPRHSLDRLKRASENEKSILIIAIDDEGFAIGETRQYGVDIKIEERIKLPGKLEAEKRGKATTEYFSRAMRSLQQLWRQRETSIVIVGVGFVKNEFASYLQESDRTIADSVVDVKSINNGGTAGIYEALRSGVLLRAAKQLRIVEETEIIEEVMKRLGKGEATITYGLENVGSAVRLGAIETLVLTDELLRESDAAARIELEQLMKETEKKNGKIVIISAEHEAGFKLAGLGGMVALLRFPLHY
ncbi:TPA: mRNA surveillance protein pelota [Candidatus Bathyarchaeota archaeon]|nr:mRNA surveillance protein pelota [Candidatus Bathyarchaeota archaeon]